MKYLRVNMRKNEGILLINRKLYGFKFLCEVIKSAIVLKDKNIYLMI